MREHAAPPGHGERLALLRRYGEALPPPDSASPRCSTATPTPAWC